MSADLRYEADYIDIPVLARYTFGKGFEGTSSRGLRSSFQLNTKVAASFLEQSGEQDVSEDVENFEFALVFGGGIELGPLLLEARWSEGLTNLAADATSEDPVIKSRTYLFLVGVRF